MEDKGIVGSLAWGEATSFAESVVVVELFRCTPFGRERRIGYHGIKLLLGEGIGFERIAILDTEIAELHSMQQHVHACKVEGGRVLLLTVY